MLMRFMWPNSFCKRRFCFKDYIMMRVIYIGLIALVFIMTASLALAEDKTSPSPLNKIHQKIMTDYPKLSHISRVELEAHLTSGDVLVLDTRPEKEYKVSHIPGALQLDPKIGSELFLRKFGHALKDKRVVVYCSVGRRSSILGSRLQNTALSAGAISVQNMEGGLFGWHNDNRPLVNASGTTTGIHPYNIFWGRLIKNKDAIRYRP